MRNAVGRFVRQSPALVVAMLALFVAMGGTAIAAGQALITGKQIKNSSITGADVKNKSLTPRDFRGSVRGPRGLTGATGATGATGPKGDKGDKGDQGIQGIQGVPGPFPDPLSAGKTLRGSYGAEITATAAGQGVVSPIPFGFTLAAAPTANIVTGAATANCPGTSADPQAAPGHLCVYPSANSNLGAGSRCIAKTGGTWSCGSADKWGATVYATANAAGRAYDVGTWAVTAPNTGTASADGSARSKDRTASTP